MGLSFLVVEIAEVVTLCHFSSSLADYSSHFSSLTQFPLFKTAEEG